MSVSDPCLGFVLVHAATHGHAERLRSAITARMVEIGLELHPDKTRIVYCKDNNRRGTHVHTSFTFLGYTFRTRSACSKHGRMFAAFLPAVSRAALVAMGRQVRRWRIHLRVGANLADLARWMNPIVRGWMQYQGAHMSRAVLGTEEITGSGHPVVYALTGGLVGAFVVDPRRDDLDSAGGGQHLTGLVAPVTHHQPPAVLIKLVGVLGHVGGDLGLQRRREPRSPRSIPHR